MEKIEITIDKEVLMRMLSQRTYSAAILERDYLQGRDAMRESLEIKDTQMSQIHLVVSRCKVENLLLAKRSRRRSDGRLRL
jgi:hypothetical protein